MSARIMEPRVGHAVWYGPQGYDEIVEVREETRPSVWRVVVSEVGGTLRICDIELGGFGGWREVLDDAPTAPPPPAVGKPFTPETRRWLDSARWGGL